MSSALWLTPPHDCAPNALLAHEVGLPALPGKGGKGVFILVVCRLRCPTTVWLVRPYGGG